MILINGKKTETIGVSDRGFQYGDGLFETIAFCEGKAKFWQQHMDRLIRGCDRLGIQVPDMEQLNQEVQVVTTNMDDAIIKVIITRGSGVRGYKPPAQQQTTRVVCSYPTYQYPKSYSRDGVSVCVCRTRFGINPALAGIKHLNRLEQVLARSEWSDETYAEGLMLDIEGNLISGTMSNVFLVQEDIIFTPDLSLCGIEGVVRKKILELAGKSGYLCEICSLSLEHLESATEVFLSNSIIGIWPIRKISKHDFKVGPVTKHLMGKLGECC